MSHLSRLSRPHQPKASRRDGRDDGTLEEANDPAVLCCGSIQGHYSDFVPLSGLTNKVQGTVKHVVATSTCLYGVTTRGRLFSLHLSSSEVTVSDGDRHSYGLLAVSLDGHYMVAFDKETEALHHWRAPGLGQDQIYHCNSLGHHSRYCKQPKKVVKYGNSK